MILFLLGCFLCISLWCRWEVRPGHRCASSPCRFLTLLGLALPLAGTVYVAARGWGSDPRASPAPGAHSASYGSMPLRETKRSEQGDGIQWTDCPAHLSLSGAPSRGKSRRFNKLGQLMRFRWVHNWKIIPTVPECGECPRASKGQRGGPVPARHNPVFVYHQCVKSRSGKMLLYFLGTIIQCVFVLLKDEVRTQLGFRYSNPLRNNSITTMSIFSVTATQMTQRTFLASRRRMIYM